MQRRRAAQFEIVNGRRPAIGERNDERAPIAGAFAEFADARRHSVSRRRSAPRIVVDPFGRASPFLDAR